MIQPRTVVVLTAALAGSAVLGACQIVVGLSGLTVTTGAGGTGGATSGTGTSSATGTTSATGTSSSSGSAGCVNSGDPCTTSGKAGICLPSPPATGTGGMGPPACQTCGKFPNNDMSTCSVCDTGAVCVTDGGVCATLCDGGEPCGTGCPDGGCGAGTVTINANESAARYDCSGPNGCDNAVVECQGPYPCTVACDGGCTGIHLTCSLTGPCTLACGGVMSCMGASVACGTNSCNVTFDPVPPGPGPPGAIACGSSCDCVHPSMFMNP